MARRKGDIVLFRFEAQEIVRVFKKQRELLIQAETSLCFPFYTACIIIVRAQRENGNFCLALESYLQAFKYFFSFTFIKSFERFILLSIFFIFSFILV